MKERKRNRGIINHDALENEIESYYIVEWYPVYPVLRDTILPDWMYPKNFMTRQEVKTRFNNGAVLH
ncbi:MAG: hypothetical protein K2J60_06955 [Acetatifactor sp.]|nr:hypothetical protein [Acetatifactor sp.]